jgi:glycosyltransferase involved in cell wall biosynthesis
MTAASLLVDLRVAQTHRERGIPRYCQSLVLAIARERPGLKIACLIDPDKDPPLMFDELVKHARIVEATAPIAGSAPITHFLQGGLFHGLENVRTLFPVELGEHRPRLSSLFYDLIPWLFPEAYLSEGPVARDYYRVIPVLSRLDRVFTISESVRRDLIAIANVSPSRAVTIYGGLDESRWLAQGTRAGEHPRAGERMWMRNDQGEPLAIPLPYWLYVGGDDFRKNLPRLIEAFASLKRAGRLAAPLVVACSIEHRRRDDLLGRARVLGLQPGIDVLFTGFVSDQTLGELFSNCFASIFPSLYEGLGLPVLESYSFGKPVLASDTSSFRELVPGACRFDPYDVASIADAIRRFHDDPSVAEESLAFAPTAIAMGQWQGAARKLGEWLDESVAPVRVSDRPRPLWVATSVPPDKSGVAFITQRSLGAPDKPVVFFVPSRSAAETAAARQSLARVRHRLQREAASADILSLGTLAQARHEAAGHPVLFVLGNSAHHLDTLAYLLAKGARPADVVHLHDISLDGLLALHFGNEKQLRVGLSDGYPTNVIGDTPQNGPSAKAAMPALLGPRLLVRRAGVRHFIVNSAAAADLLRRDLADDAALVTIDVLFHPILPATIRPLSSTRDPMRIGHFGILHARKQPDRLVAACDMLSRRHRIELIFAGYFAQQFLTHLGLKRDYIRVIESPSDEELEEIMAGVDCAVQLRYPDQGESSGVVNQLVALRRPVICTRTGSFLEMGDAVRLVDADVSPADLADTIEQAVRDGPPAGAEGLIRQRSPSLFEAHLRKLLGLDPTTTATMSQANHL